LDLHRLAVLADALEEAGAPDEGGSPALPRPSRSRLFRGRSMPGPELTTRPGFRWWALDGGAGRCGGPAAFVPVSTGVEVITAWRVYLVSALVACVVAAATTFVTMRLLGPQATTHSATTVLEGVAEMRSGAQLEVFYKTPFDSPPNLTFPDGLGEVRCHVTEQKAGSFTLTRDQIPGIVEVAKVK